MRLITLLPISQWPLFTVQPQVISIHLPKTAGSSFYEALHYQYGCRLKHLYQPKDWVDFENKPVFKCAKPGVKAIHGHLHHLQLAWKTRYPNARWVTWLRDPADRVVSAYYHWLKPINHQDPNHQSFLKLQPSLLGFASNPVFYPVVNTYTTILGTVAPEDFYFIGRTAFFQEDLNRLAKQLNWKPMPIFAANVNAQKPVTDPAMLADLKELLAPEYAIYNQFLAAHHPPQVLYSAI